MRTFSETMQAAIALNTGEWVALLEINLASGAVIRYTTCWADVTWDSQTWVAHSFEIPSSNRQTNISDSDISVRIDNVNQALSGVILTDQVQGQSLRLRIIYVDGATGAPIGETTDFIDLVDSTVAEASANDLWCVLTARSWKCLMERECPARNFGPACPWRFGDTNCAFDSDTTKLAAQTADAGCTASVIADAARTEAANYWKDGVIEFTSGTQSGKKRKILSSATGTVTVEFAFDAAPAAGDAYTIRQGCDKSYDTCLNAFANTANFGGFVNLQN